jgi:2-methylisocitrate lyase-like PEP mutase family enzyme
VRLLAEAGAAGCSIEDYDPGAQRVDDVGLAAERVAIAAEASGEMVLTARCESHLYGAADLDDTIARLVAYRDAGADVAYAPGLTDLDQIAAVVAAVGVPVNVLALPNGPTIAELESVGVRRVSVGSQLAGAAYGALVGGARELLEDGTSRYAEQRLARELVQQAFG